ncbi:hypothetical protein EDB80DRAFT_33268 [Ilyonectria destructans]|nr:hypothetical protein EDB80DRAFT_33268 [Ilyonectria destructans]
MGLFVVARTRSNKRDRIKKVDKVGWVAHHDEEGASRVHHDNRVPSSVDTILLPLIGNPQDSNLRQAVTSVVLSCPLLLPRHLLTNAEQHQAGTHSTPSLSLSHSQPGHPAFIVDVVPTWLAGSCSRVVFYPPPPPGKPTNAFPSLVTVDFNRRRQTPILVGIVKLPSPFARHFRLLACDPPLNQTAQTPPKSRERRPTSQLPRRPLSNHIPRRPPGPETRRQ